jgi:beta-lactam-binding protein with PASTA domain
MSTDRAVSTLRAADLVPVVSYVDDTCTRVSRVVTQNPGAGTQVARGSAVSIEVTWATNRPCP